VVGKEVPTMNRTVVKVVFAVLVAAAEIFIRNHEEIKKGVYVNSSAAPQRVVG
jgi:hypothetical protein